MPGGIISTGAMTEPEAWMQRGQLETLAAARIRVALMLNCSVWSQGLVAGATLRFTWPRPVGAGQFPDPPQTHLLPCQEQTTAEPTQAVMPHDIPRYCGWTA